MRAYVRVHVHVCACLYERAWPCEGVRHVAGSVPGQVRKWESKKEGEEWTGGREGREECMADDRRLSKAGNLSQGRFVQTSCDQLQHLTSFS